MTQNQKPTEVILIGLGKMGQFHLNKILSSNDFTLKAVLDPFADFASLSLPKGVRTLRTLDETDDIEYEVAIVASATETHFEIVTNQLHKNKHIFVEKPAASSVKQVDEILSLTKEKELKIAVGHIERSNQAFILLNELIKENFIGKVLHTSSARGGKLPPTIKKGNNVLIDLAVHELDALSSIHGKLTLNSASHHSIHHKDIIDFCDMKLKSQSGAIASVNVNWHTPHRIRELRVIGTEGVLELDYATQTLEAFGKGLASRAKELQKDFIQKDSSFDCDHIFFEVKKQDALAYQLDQFHKYLNDKKHNLCIEENIVDTLKLCEDAASFKA